ncbi:hypothetical protein ACSQ67_009372 [Phaseolus vulgaris]
MEEQKGYEEMGHICHCLGLDIQLHDRRNMSGQLEIQSNRIFRSQIPDDASISMTLSRKLLYRWSVEELRLATGAKGITHLQHQLKLRSAYSGVPGDHKTRDDIGEPLATSYHSKFMGTVDYIWHSDDLVPLRVLETLPIDILRRSGGLPSEKWGSDHLAVVCELAFSKQQQCMRSMMRSSCELHLTNIVLQLFCKTPPTLMLRGT